MAAAFDLRYADSPSVDEVADAVGSRCAAAIRDRKLSLRARKVSRAEFLAYVRSDRMVSRVAPPSIVVQFLRRAMAGNTTDSDSGSASGSE